MMKGSKVYRNMRMAGIPPRNLRLQQSSDATPEKPTEPGCVEPPAWLEADAREIFATKVAQIQAAGYWAERFEDSLALLASLLAEYQRNPAQASAAKVTQMRLLLSELALTPASSRVVAQGPSR